MVKTTPDSSEVAEHRFELNIRSLASRTKGGIQERALEMLDQLNEDGAVESMTVRVWGERVALSTAAVETDRRREVLDRIGTFRDWAKRADVTLAPFFDHRSTTSSITGEEYTRLHLPVVAPAEYEGKAVVHVTPHEDDGTVCTVGDRLDRLDELGRNSERTESVTPTSSLN